jgi:hypothetical protein
MPELCARHGAERGNSLGDRIMVLDACTKGAAHHDLLAVWLDILDAHARVTLQLSLRSRQHDPEAFKDLIRWGVS